MRELCVNGDCHFRSHAPEKGGLMCRQIIGCHRAQHEYSQASFSIRQGNQRDGARAFFEQHGHEFRPAGLFADPGDDDRLLTPPHPGSRVVIKHESHLGLGGVGGHGARSGQPVQPQYILGRIIEYKTQKIEPNDVCQRPGQTAAEAVRVGVPGDVLSQFEESLVEPGVGWLRAAGHRRLRDPPRFWHMPSAPADIGTPRPPLTLPPQSSKLPVVP